MVLHVYINCYFFTTAQSGFVGLTNITFASGTQPFGPDSQMCVNISISDDQFVEETERFVVCGCSTQAVIQNDGCTHIFIEDDDSKFSDGINCISSMHYASLHFRKCREAVSFICSFHVYL